MAGEFFIVTFGPDGETGLPEDLIPIAVIEQHFRPFMKRYRVTDDTDHEVLLVYPVLTRDRDGNWVPDTSSRGQAVNDAEMSFTESAPGSGLIRYISFDHHPDHHAFEAGVFAILASASAVAIGPDGMCPVAGRAETITNMPPDMVASMGLPYLATSPESLWLGPEKESTPPPPRDLPPTDRDLNIQRARQAQVVNLKREQVAIIIKFQLADLSGMIDQIRIEHPVDDQLPELEGYADRLAAAFRVCGQLESSGWDGAARVAIDEILRLQLPSLINKGAITHRFAPRLQRMDAIIASITSRFLPDAAREQERWVELDRQARARGLPVLTSDEPDIADLPNWPDAVLKAEHKRRHQRLDGDRGDIRFEFKSSAQFASEWLAQSSPLPAAATTLSDEAAFHTLLVNARKAVKDTARADWDDAVLDAVQALLNFGLPARLNARQMPGLFDLHFREMGLRLQLSLPERMDRLHAQTVQLEMLDAEIMRRGIDI
jgi:hypothetical protein